MTFQKKEKGSIFATRPVSQMSITFFLLEVGSSMIGELVQVRDGQLHLHISQCELCTFIEYVCMM